MVVQLQKIGFRCFAEWFNRLSYSINVCWTSVYYNAYIILKSSQIYGSSWDKGCFMKNVCFDTICNITQEPQELHRYDCVCGFIRKSVVIKYPLLSKVISINVKSHFEQVAIYSFLLYLSLRWFGHQRIPR